MPRISTALLLVFVSLPAWPETPAEAFAAGKAAGQSSVEANAARVNPTEAGRVVPRFGTAAPETGMFASPSLPTNASARIAACSGAAPNDQYCAAVRFGQTNPLTRPRLTITPADATIIRGDQVANNPSSILGAVGGTYSGCANQTLFIPPRFENQKCQQFLEARDFTCQRILTVNVTWNSNCTVGTWVRALSLDRNGDDHMYVDVLCEPSNAGTLKFRTYAHGGRGACVDWVSADLPLNMAPDPALWTTLSPHWEGSCTPLQVWHGAGRCVGDSCNKFFYFGNGHAVCTGINYGGTCVGGASHLAPPFTLVYGACPAGQIPHTGIRLHRTATVTDPDTGSPITIHDYVPGTPGQCYAFTPGGEVNAAPALRLPDTYGTAYTTTFATPTGFVVEPASADWAFAGNSGFTRPNVTSIVTDAWEDQCAPFEARTP